MATQLDTAKTEVNNLQLKAAQQDKEATQLSERLQREKLGLEKDLSSSKEEASRLSRNLETAEGKLGSVEHEVCKNYNNGNFLFARLAAKCTISLARKDEPAGHVTEAAGPATDATDDDTGDRQERQRTGERGTHLVLIHDLWLCFCCRYLYWWP